MTDLIAEPTAGMREAAARRAEKAHGPDAQSRAAAPPSGAARIWLPFPADMRAKTVEHDGQERYELTGYASVVERGYEMWDWAGPYVETIAADAFDETLAAEPDVAFLVNHTGITMARTTNKTVELSADALGLRSVAYLNPKRADVQTLVTAIEDKDVTEMSFAFMIDEGGWNDDLTEFRINKIDIDRGDVSAVNYGANPYTSIAARSRQMILHDLEDLPTGVARAALERLSHRPDLVAPVAAVVAEKRGTVAFYEDLLKFT